MLELLRTYVLGRISLPVPLQALGRIYNERRICACGRHVIDGDHIHSCKKNTGSSKAAREAILLHPRRLRWRPSAARL
jgi:hypothetical protein